MMSTSVYNDRAWSSDQIRHSRLGSAFRPAHEVG
jgi:hypothetical protein